jgi:hypothetical protein
MSGQENVEVNDGRDESGGRENCDVAAELKSLEAKLASLSPRPDRLDRDRLMFLAGQASLLDAKVNRPPIFGEKLESRAWPAAFAAMSAVAAALLVMLIARPVNQARRLLPAESSVRQAAPRIATGRRSNELMLSPLDARIGDIDRWLTRNDVQFDGTGPIMEPIPHLRLPILTPASWEQVINEPDPIDASPSGASNFRQLQGAHS